MNLRRVSALAAMMLRSHLRLSAFAALDAVNAAIAAAALLYNSASRGPGWEVFGAAAAAASVALPVAVADARYSAWHARWGFSPAEVALAQVASRLAAALPRALAAAAVCAAVGIDVAAVARATLVALTVAAAVGAGFSYLSMALSAIGLGAATGPVSAAAGILLSGMWFSIELLPGWLSALAYANPQYAVTAAASAAISGGLSRSLLHAAALAAAFATAASLATPRAVAAAARRSAL